MVMPLDLFITPFTDQTHRSSPYAPLGELGKDLSDRAYKQKTFAEGQRRFDVENARRSAADKSTAAYHEDLIAARREGSRDAAQAKRDARVNVLMDQLKKSAAANKWDEVDMIRQELTRLGYATDESDTAFTPPETPVAAQPPEVPAPKVPAPKGPKVDPKFAKALGSYMAEDKPTEAPGDTSSPFPWEDLGMPAPAKPKGKGGRFTIRDPQGNLAMVLDQPMEMEKDRASIEAALAPFIEDPQNPESQGAAHRASQTAQRAIATGMPADKALQLGLQAYKAEMQRYKTQRLPSAQPTGGGGGISKQEQSMEVQTFDKTLNAVREGRMEQALVKARTDVSEADHMDALLNSEDAFSNRAAMMDWLHAKIGSAQSKSELDNALGGAGKAARLEMMINEWTDGGRMPNEIRRGLQTAVQASRKAAQARIDAAGESTADFLRQTLPSFVSPEVRERNAAAASNFLTGKKPVNKAREDLDKKTREMLKGYK